MLLNARELGKHRRREGCALHNAPYKITVGHVT